MYVLKVLLFCPCSQQRSVFSWLTLLSKLFLSKLVIIITVRSRLHTSVCSSRKTEPWKILDCGTFPYLCLKKCFGILKGFWECQSEWPNKTLGVEKMESQRKRMEKRASGGSPVSR